MGKNVDVFLKEVEDFETKIQNFFNVEIKGDDSKLSDITSNIHSISYSLLTLKENLKVAQNVKN